MAKTILIIGCSIRSSANEDIIIQNVRRISNDPDLYEYIEQVARSREISNSEGGAIAAAYGAQAGKTKLSYLRLNDYIDKKGNFLSILATGLRCCLNCSH